MDAEPRKLTWDEWVQAWAQPLIHIDQEIKRLGDKAAELRRKEHAEGLGNLAHANLDQANWMLRNGAATKANAEAYVEMWNRPGHRLTRAELRERSIPFGDTGMLVPYIILHDAP